MSAQRVEVYMSKEAEASVLSMRRRLVEGLPFPVSDLRVKTFAGQTYVTVCGPEDAPPLMLWQGSNGPAPLLLRGLEPLVKQYRIYTADPPAHGGSLSEPCKVSPTNHGLGLWAKEVMQGLAPHLGPHPKPLHVGISYGGAVLMDLACVAPELIQAAVLWVPISLSPEALTLSGMVRVMVRVVLPWLLYRSFPTAFMQRWLMGAIGDADMDVTMADACSLIVRSIRPQGNLAPARFSKEELAGLAAPVLVITGRDDVFGKGEAAAAEARRVFSNVEAVVFPSNHMFGPANLAAATQKVLQFLGEAGSSSGASS